MVFLNKATKILICLTSTLLHPILVQASNKRGDYYEDMIKSQRQSDDNVAFTHEDKPHIMSPNPNLYQLTYSDGIKSPFIRIKVQGNLTSSTHDIYEETLDGFTVEIADNIYLYVEVDDTTGEYIETGLVAGVDDPYLTDIKEGSRLGRKLRNNVARLRRNILDEKRKYELPVRKLRQNDASTMTNENMSRRRAKITSGTLKNLVIPFKFSNHASKSLPSRNDLNILMNNEGPKNGICPTGSVRDVYLKNSFNDLYLESEVVSWVTIDYTESYCAAGQDGLDTKFHVCLRNALDKVVAGGLDLTEFDMDNDGFIDGITFLHSGYGAEWGRGGGNRIWSHKWSLYSQNWSSNGVRVYDYHISSALWGTTGSNIGRIGVIAHETGHFLGLPDLYDYGGGNGIGSYGLMANSWGYDNSQLYPPHTSSWSKYKLNWVNPKIAKVSGTYSLRSACDYPDMIMIKEGYPGGEYLLIENRQPCGFDAAIRQGGLAIFHIDESANNNAGYPSQSGWPENGNHYEVALLQADGGYDMERGYDRGDQYDLFRGGYTDSIGPSGISGTLTANHPNTKAYRGGNIRNTEVKISNISASGSIMTFKIIFGGDHIISESPTCSNLDCCDSTIRFKITKDDGSKAMRSCGWVRARNISGRCGLEGVSAACSSSCDACGDPCEDSSLRFKITKDDGSKIMRDCGWVASKNLVGRCALSGVEDACRSTCGKC